MSSDISFADGKVFVGFGRHVGSFEFIAVEEEMEV